ncbi:MAG: tetratricopeptide repeat protein [Desulfobulbus sp.]
MRLFSLHFFLFFLALPLASFSASLAASTLTAVNRSDESSSIQFFLQFDQETPQASLVTNGKRIDVTLEKTMPAPSLRQPETDSRMIRMVSAIKQDSTILSFYFRYPPQKASIENRPGSSMLMLSVLLGNKITADHPELASAFQGLSVVKKNRPSALNPITITPYAKDWRSFFIHYEPPVATMPPPVLHLPPFPLASAVLPRVATESWLPETIMQSARAGLWNEACPKLRAAINQEPDERLKERLVLSYAEALVRARVYREPHYLLQRIMIQYPDSRLADLAHLLLIYHQATHGDQVNAYHELNDFIRQSGAALPQFADSLTLLLAETALWAGRTREAADLLNKPELQRNQSLEPVRKMRQADLLALENKQDQALASYRELPSRPPTVDNDPMSLALFSDCLYRAGEYPEAARRYRRLGDLLNGEPDQSFALYRLAATQLHLANTRKKARIDLQQIEDAFPEKWGGIRAQIRRIDLDYAENRISASEALAVYETYALTGDTIALREETGFKRALVNFLEGRHETSIQQCMQLLREFQSGALRTETKALLLQQIPEMISRYVRRGEYVQALVLIKQNRDLFVRGWLDGELLYDLAKAYTHLGMDEEAAQTYQYLFDLTDDREKEKVYLPLMRSLFISRKYSAVEEYANRYLLRYPQGAHQEEVSRLKLQALYASGQSDKALDRLTSTDGQPQEELMKARILADRNEWKELISVLEQSSLLDKLEDVGMRIPLAEAYFQTGEHTKAAALFRQIGEGQEGRAQALFRLAQIEQQTGDPGEALKQFKKLADNKEKSAWTRLAREEAAILEMRSR